MQYMSVSHGHSTIGGIEYDDGHLHSPLISRVDVRLSFFLSSPQQPPPSYSIPPIVLYPWLTLMYCVKVEKT